MNYCQRLVRIVVPTQHADGHAAIGLRPVEAARQAELASAAIGAARERLLALFDERVDRDRLYDKPAA